MLTMRVEDLIEDYMEHYEVGRSEAVDMMIDDLEDEREEPKESPMVTVLNRCSQCNAKIQTTTEQATASMLMSTKEAVCNSCNPESSWQVRS